MRVLAFPVRLDSAGAFASVEQWSDAQSAQTAEHVVSTAVGERELAPDFGLVGLLDDGVSEDEVYAAMDLCEPDLEVLSVAVNGPTDRRQSVTVTVRWSDDDDLGDF